MILGIAYAIKEYYFINLLLTPPARRHSTQFNGINTIFIIYGMQSVIGEKAIELSKREHERHKINKINQPIGKVIFFIFIASFAKQGKVSLLWVFN